MKINPRSGKFAINLFGQALPDQAQQAEFPTSAISEEQVEAAASTPTGEEIEEVTDSEPQELPVELLESSFEKIKPRADEFVASFYENLFTAHPEVKPLFANTDMEKQQKKLLNSLVLVVESLRNPEALAPVLEALGSRHVGYGAIPISYGPVGEALLLTFEQYLQSDWTNEIKQAWVAAYRAITSQMLKDAGVNHAPKQVQLKTKAIPNKPIVIAPTKPTEDKLKEVAQQEPQEFPVELLESSFEKIKPRADEFVASFYENLFAAQPEVKPLFANTDMEKQQKKLLNALVLVGENLRNPEALMAVPNTLEIRQIPNGAILKYYSPVVKTLLTTFEQYLQSDWTPELKQAWADGLRVISGQMLKSTGANSAPKAVQVKTMSIPEKSLEAAAVTSVGDKLEEVSDSKPKELPIELLQSSFEKIKPHAQEFAASFYENLFAAHPEVKPLFATTDMEKQQKKFLNTLVLVVESFRHPDALEEVLSALGARHVGYGAIPKYYGPVVNAVMTTFEQYLQEDWTNEIKQAWANALKAITQAMLKGAGVESSPKAVQNQKAATIKKPSLLKTEIVNESQQFPPQLLVENWQQIPKQVIGRITDSYRQLQPQLSGQKWQPILKEITKKITDTFWELPAWVVVPVAGVMVGGLFLLADEGSVLAELLGDADAISLVLALVLFIKEAPDRKKQFHYQAWSIVDGAHGIKKSYARVIALQDLNQDGVPLKELDAPGAELDEINLPHANLSEANLSEADLSNGNLSHANLDKANLSKAKLSGTNLSHANLSFANLSEANFSSANLSSANLICADLSNTNLTGVNLKNASLSGANLKGAYLMGANLKGAKVSAYDLSGALLEGAIMPDGKKYKSVD